MDYRPYLLYTKAQEQAFRTKYAAHLQLLSKYEDWFYTFPLYEWQRANYCFKFPPELDGEALIMRYARNNQEYQEYTNKLFKK